MSKSAGGSRETTKSETNVDAQTQDWVNRIYGASKVAAGGNAPGVDPLSNAAGQFYGSQMAGAGVGSAALGGDAGALQSLMNPYQQQVLDAQGAEWGRINDATMQNVNDAATAAGAFGGSRHGVATGAALSRNAQTQAAEAAALRSAGYGDAMNRAGALVNFGFGGAQGGHDIGQYNRDVAIERMPGMWKMNVLRQGLQGLPFGQTTYGSNAKTHGSASFSIPFLS